jgi:transcriptional regulator with XRE-family HTH domain
MEKVHTMVKHPAKIPSKNASSEIVKLGENIAIARKRRRLTQKRVADGAGVTVATIRRLENGDAGVSLGTLAMTLLVLGERGHLSNLLDAAVDEVGMVISVNDLPRRVREKSKKTFVSGTDSGQSIGYNSEGDFVGF